MKVYVILSDYFPTTNNESVECGIFEGVYPTKDKAINRLSDMIHTAHINDPELVFYRIRNGLAKMLKDAIVAYGAHTDNADQYIYIRECDLEGEI